MTRLMITSDLHLGHKNIHQFRGDFACAEDHHEFMFEQLAVNIQKRDSLFLLGDIAFDKYWLNKIKEIKCVKKTLILGNHDTENGIKFNDFIGVYDDVHSLFAKRNIWFSHCPIHPHQFRGKLLNIHGHLHDKTVRTEPFDVGEDSRYRNACVEHTHYKPISFADLIKQTKEA